ncbi:MAG: hypothetical protein WCA98_02690 [Candidatus Acidiferrales bacterium]
MSQVTHEQAEMLLKLYDLRRETKLREARAWFIANFHPASFDEVVKNFPPGSEGGAYMRMVIGYWDMFANFSNRGLVDEEMTFETSGEQWLVWELMKPVIVEWRAASKNPFMAANLEEHAKRLEAWREKRAPGHNETMRRMIAQMTGAHPGAKSSTAGN